MYIELSLPEYRLFWCGNSEFKTRNNCRETLRGGGGHKVQHNKTDSRVKQAEDAGEGTKMKKKEKN